jgi:shikimate 5-dehydrogenase
MTYLSGRAALAGVMGWPVGHSLSPRLHGFWLHQLHEVVSGRLLDLVQDGGRHVAGGDLA